MAKDESKLVEEVVESTETAEQNGIEDKFNPLQFTSDTYGVNDKEESVEEVDDSTEKVKTETKEEETKEEEAEQEEGWAWDAKETEEKKKEEDDYDWDGKSSDESSEAPVADTSGLDWGRVSKELGVEAGSRDELVNVINTVFQQQQQQQVSPNDQVSELKSYLNFSDRDLVGEELKADGIEESDVEESLDKLEDAGMMKMKAKSIRRVINNAIDQQTEYVKNASAQNTQQKQEAAKQARDILKKQIKDMKEFMGGKVTKKQKEEAYRFATGDMMNEIWSNHANVADVAMFMLYRKQIEKILRSQGLEDGKASVMDSIVSPSLNTGKSKSNFKVKSGKFDPKAFMNE